MAPVTEFQIHEGYDRLMREADAKALCNKVEKFNTVSRMRGTKFMKLLEDFVYEDGWDCHGFAIVKERGGREIPVEQGYPWKKYWMRVDVNGGPEGDSFAGQCWVGLGRGWYFTWHYSG